VQEILCEYPHIFALKEIGKIKVLINKDKIILGFYFAKS